MVGKSGPSKPDALIPSPAKEGLLSAAGLPTLPCGRLGAPAPDFVCAPSSVRSASGGSTNPVDSVLERLGVRSAAQDRDGGGGTATWKGGRLISEGQIVKGRVVRLEEYGAFVEVPLSPEDPNDNRVVTGLCHVSEVDRDYVENIFAYLAEGQEVDVKVLNIKEDGKVDLSIKQGDPDWEPEPPQPRRSKLDKDFDKRLRRFMHVSQMIQGEARRQREARR